MQNFAPLNLVINGCDGTIAPLEVRGEFSFFLSESSLQKTPIFQSRFFFFLIMNWNTE